MPAFGYVEYENASPEVKAVYDDIMATRGVDWISNFWKSIAHDPALLRRTWETLKEIMRPDGAALDPLTKEMMYLAVSASNQCHYCIASHTAASWKAGMTAEMFGELMSIVGMANETNRLVSGYQVEVDDRFKVRDAGWKQYPSPRKVAERYVQACVECDLQAIDEIVDPAFVGFDGNEQGDREGLKQRLAAIRSAITGMRFEIQQIHATGEWVSIIDVATGVHSGSFMGLEPSNREFSVRGMVMLRVVKGKVVEAHGHWDSAAFLRQIAR